MAESWVGETRVPTLSDGFVLHRVCGTQVDWYQEICWWLVTEQEFSAFSLQNG